ncbi:TlpA disulfide reductase family protein [Gimesia algae]|uniref:Thiol-disulfide oxidoreductase ResA n=1 Tax=Gimesia algae TaxID=2527971 RepID=A0A517VGU4_9PLAN|nr:TlpA disulfide reductase family protein [Gimesia algae]QDT92232.1 Thiol-disulfide oxidoreductase ResA [Gimesia algae]
MSGETYNLVIYLIAITMSIAIGVLVFSLGFMLLRWKTPKRRGHALRLLSSVIAIIGLYAVTYVVSNWIYWPSLVREKIAEANAFRAERLIKTSVVQEGDTAPDFSVTTTDGELFSLAAARGEVVLINFYSNWCGPCRLELPHIQQIWDERKKNPGFRLLVIGREETEEKVKQFCEEYGFTFPVAPDPKREIYSQFAHELIPRTFVVSPEGKIVFSSVGFYQDDLEKLKVVLDQQRAGLPVENSKPAVE